jgi:hypothetical protein
MPHEFNGLRAVLSSEATMHAMPEPPSRDDFDNDQAFEDAHDAWWINTHCWHVELKPAEEG